MKSAMPEHANYQWQRRWITLTTDHLKQKPYTPDNSGYVAGTTWGPGLVAKPIGVTLEELGQDLFCVVLLGEPGIGKSHEYNKLRESLKDRHDHVFLDLGSFTTEDVLRREIEESPKVVQWQKSDTILTLWLDSLDEGLLHLSRLQDGILRVLRRLDLKRLRLRITCRNAVWPTAFTEALQNLWGIPANQFSQHFAILLLSPLTQHQVRQAAEQEGFDTEQFLEAIASVNAQPLASSPVTLQLLINLYRDNQPTFGISESLGRTGLYERGCLFLCEVPDRKRDEQFKRDSRTRLLLAGYLAFLAVLTNKRLIHMEPVLGSIGLNELDPYTIGTGQTVEWEGIQAPITEQAIRDLLKNTGLFTDVANKQMAWTHQSYAEFLAAWYLNLTKLPPVSLKSLFRSTADPSGGVIPALQETAAWLAELQPVFWDEILELDPLSLIQSDLRHLSDNQRAAVVARLIIRLSSLAYPPYRDSSERSFMQYLRHPELANQLLPLLTNPASPGATRRFATDMTIACKVQELLPALVTQALDTSIPFGLRANALDILVLLADDNAKFALRPLLQMPIPAEDVRDEFRGDLLRILWPDYLTPDELLPLLTREKEDHYYGSYRVFLDQIEKEADLEFSLAPVLASMRWLANHFHQLSFESKRERYWKTIIRLVLRRAWQLIYEPGTLHTMADLFIAFDKEHEYFNLEGSTDDGRLALLKSLLQRSDRPHPYSLVHNHYNLPALLSQKDWNSVYPLIYISLSASAREWLTRILMFLLRQTLGGKVNPEYSQHYDQLLEAKRRFASSRKAFYTWYKVVDLDSDEAKEARKNTIRNRKREIKELKKKKVRRKNTLYNILRERRLIQKILLNGTTASFREWYLLLHYISSRREKTGFLSHNDVSQSPGWTKLSETQKTGVIDLACDVVSRYPVPPDNWYDIDKNLVSTYGLALYRALLLCHSQRPAYAHTLSVSFWEKWAFFLVQMDSFGNDRSYILSRLAAEATPSTVDTALFIKADSIDSRKEGESFYEFSDWYKALPAAKFPNNMLLAIKFGVWREDFSANLLIAMLKEDFQPAWDFAMQLIQEANNAGPKGLERQALITAVYSWLLFNRDTIRYNAWDYWELLSCNPNLAATIIERSVSRATRGDLKYLATFDEEQLHTFVLWLTYAFQLTAEDVDDWEEINPKGSFAALRIEAVIELASRGTELAWEILKQLSIQMGEPFWLRFRIDQVRENLRRNSWDPIGPDALIKLSQNASRRWVQSAKDLQELILESLSRFQADLHNELIAAEVLWLPVKDPKDKRKILGYELREENFLSNVIRRHLVQDLQRSDILIKREVEIRPSFGAGTGQRTDIFVDAYSLDKGGNKTDVVSLVIEVKLSKNGEVETSLHDQLIPYLTDQKYKHGIYLIGWHFGEHYSRPQNRKPLPDLNKLLKEQTHAAGHDYTIKALLLDIRLPADKERNESERRFFEII